MMMKAEVGKQRIIAAAAAPVASGAEQEAIPKAVPSIELIRLTTMMMEAEALQVLLLLLRGCGWLR